ncbi:MAG: hypothetical protein U9O83_07915 [Campylobacterota bacterium]|nr:hypothetical protein [Campylobacterota bacterium]
MKTTTKILMLKKENEMLNYIDRVWEVLEEGYENVKGGLYFKSKSELLTNTTLWKVVLFQGKVVAVTIYKAKKGLKLVAMSISNKFRDVALSALARLIRRDLKICWMELSEAAESFVMKHGGKDYIVPNHLVEKILGKNILLADDGMHYTREVMHMKKKKILLGTIKISKNFQFIENGTHI